MANATTRRPRETATVIPEAKSVAPAPSHDFAAGALIRDTKGRRYVVTESRWTAILEQTLGDGPIAYHIGDGSLFRGESSHD